MALPTAPVSSFTSASPAGLGSQHSPLFSPPWADPCGELLCIPDNQADAASLEPPFLFCELMEFRTHVSYSLSHSVFTTTCWTTHPRTRICMLLALAFSNTLDKLSRLRVPRGQLFVSLSVSSKQGRAKWLLKPLLQPTEETDL